MTPPAAFNLVVSPDGNLLLQAPPSSQYAALSLQLQRRPQRVTRRAGTSLWREVLCTTSSSAHRGGLATCSRTLTFFAAGLPKDRNNAFCSCVRATFRCVKAQNELAMLLLVFKDGSSTQFCSFEAENIAKLLQVTIPHFTHASTHAGAVSSRCCSAMLLLMTEGGVG